MFSIGTNDVQSLAHIVKLEYLPTLAEIMNEDPTGLLRQRHDELTKVIDHVLSDNFFMEDLTNS